MLRCALTTSASHQNSEMKAYERTVYVISEDGALAEYIYIDGKPFCIGRSDIFNTIKRPARKSRKIRK